MQPETHQNRTLSVGYSLGVVKMEAFEDSHFMHHTVRGGHTERIVSLMACIFDLKNKFYATENSSKLGYSLGMVKMEAFEDSHFMHHTVSGGHTEHTGSIVSLMACVFDLKNKFYATENSSKLGYSLGMVKMEAFEDSHFMHHTVTLLGVVILNTLVASFLSWHASLILKRNFSATVNSSKSNSGLWAIALVW